MCNTLASHIQKQKLLKLYKLIEDEIYLRKVKKLIASNKRCN